jgi:hypothetical protein
MTIRNRELSQFGSFIYIDNDTKDIGITTLSTPFVGIGTTNATSKFHVYGETKLEGDVNLTGISTFDSNVFVGSAVSIYSSTGIVSATEFKGAVTGDVDGNAGTATSLATARDFSITGDFVTATAVSFDGTGNVSLAATITADSIELGTYTSGDYVASISGTANQVSIDITSGEGTTPTISLPNEVELPGNLKVTSGISTLQTLYVGVAGTIGITTILDEDDLTSSRDDALATQQSIKAYVDNTLDLLNLDAQGDTGVVSIDLDTEILEIAGTTNEIETVGSGNSITIGLPNEVEISNSLTVGSATTITGDGIVSGIVTASLDGNAGTATSLATARDFSIAGDFVTATAVSFDGTGNVALAATITENSVGLGTYTSGDYVKSITGTANEIEVSVTSGEGSTPQIGLPDDVTIGGDLTVTGLTTTNTLYVAGVSTFNGVLNTNSSVSIGSTVNATAYYQNGTLLVDAALQQWEDATLDSGTSIYRDFGNVGIGTSTNLAKLSVNGQIESQATSGTAPFIVQSQTTVENLSAKLLDGKSAPTGSIVGTTDSQTLTTKTINLSNNTLSGTTAEFNTALSDDDFATLNNSVTLTNKTLTSPAISTITDGGSGSQDIPAGIGTLVSTSSVGIITTGMIKDGEIVNADVSASAAIDYSKLNLSGSIVDGDITTGTIANDKLANSTISGISLGSNLADLTRGTDVLYNSGTTYNGGSAITISVDSSTAATANKIVKRDADGGIAANDITAGVGYTFYGDGSGITGITADVAVKVSTADTSTAGPFYLTFVDSNNTPAEYESLFTDGGIFYDASTANLSLNGSVSATGGFNIGIQSAGVEQTTGVVTAINFIGLGNTFNYNAGTKTIDVSIESGSGGGDSLWESYATGISTTSNVGIGTTNAEAKLSIDVGAGITALDIQGSEGQLFSVTNNLTSGSIFSVNDVSGLPSIDVDADGTIQLATYGGNVGIATTNPTEKLHVDGNIQIADGGSIISNAGSVTISADPSQTQAPSQINMVVDGAEVADFNNGGYLRFNKTDWVNGGVCTQSLTDVLNLAGGQNPLNSGLNIALSGPDSTSNWGYLARWNTANVYGYNKTSDYHAWYTGSGTERMRLDSSGNIGIGTNNPGYSLSVNRTDSSTLLAGFTGGAGVAFLTVAASGTTSNAVRFGATGDDGVLWAGGAEVVRIDSSGNIGIGTNNPGDLLHLQSAEPVIRLQDSDGTDQYSLIRQASAAIYYDSRNNTGAGVHIFRSWNGSTFAEKMRISASGNVGIATDAPSQLLDVNGNARFRSAVYDNNNVVGAANSVLTSTGSGVVWAAPTGGGGEGGSGTYDTGITTSVYASVSGGIGTAQAGLSTVAANNNIFIGPGIAYSFPATAGKSYVIESIHVTNIYNDDLYFTSRHDFDGGENVPTAQRVIVPYQGAVELLEQPIIANPSDELRFQAFAGVGTTATGINNGLDSFIVYSEKTDTDYIGTGATVVTPAGTELFTSTTNPSVLQSIRLCNYDLAIDVDASVSIYRGGTVGGIVTTGVRQGYLVYNLTVPKNSVIEILEKPKYLAANDTIVVGVAGTTITNSLSATLSGKYIV